jgi:hypothetical protein
MLSRQRCKVLHVNHHFACISPQLTHMPVAANASNSTATVLPTCKSASPPNSQKLHPRNAPKPVRAMTSVLRAVRQRLYNDAKYSDKIIKDNRAAPPKLEGEGNNGNCCNAGGEIMTCCDHGNGPFILWAANGVEEWWVEEDAAENACVVLFEC